MAAPRLRRPFSCRKWFRRNQTIFLLLLLVFQLIIVYNLYSISERESQNVEQLFVSRQKVPDFQQKTWNETVNPALSLQRRHEADKDLENVVTQKTSAMPKSTQKTDAEKGWRASCTLQGQDITSALRRASTDNCKQTIADVGCRLNNNTMFPKWLPRFCKAEGLGNVTHLGCYVDVINDRDLNDHSKPFPDLTPHSCIYHCLRSGYPYAGVQYGRECFCGKSFGKHGKADSEEKCDYPCSGDKAKICGGFKFQNIYATGVGEVSRLFTGKVLTSSVQGMTAARIAFVLTLNGRAVRQVKRLIKAIYHVNHYFYIHVDSRQEYLFHELLFLEKRFANVRLARTRMSTIWGGASLLQMLLQCMHDLLTFKDWHWDFFINLSESDFPIKVNDELTAYFTLNKDKNFVKSHGRDTPKFIQKQGLEKTFVECDTHMWRVGNRNLPDNIRIDGGSDWINLNRRFCEYVINGDDALIKGLHEVWKYSLLPGESFFHTVLWNSEFCHTYVDNNLHITNWWRKRGCKCQYKHIVDWCGCSPNDFMPESLSRLKASEGKPLYFARKFEAIVNSEIINNVERWLYGDAYVDTPSWESYWQNDYHALDAQSKTSDTKYTFYHVFATMGNALAAKKHSCSFKLASIEEVIVYQVKDVLQGLVILYNAFSSPSARGKRPIQLEVFVKPKGNFTQYSKASGMERLQDLQVGTDFDPKELIFRNYGNLMGPHSDPRLRAAWSKTSKSLTVAFNVVWIDPVNNIQLVDSAKVMGREANVTDHKTDFAKPIMPGKWRVKLVMNGAVMAEVSFFIVPLLFKDKVLLNNSETAKQLNGGPTKASFIGKFGNFEHLLELGDKLALEEKAQENAALVSEALASHVYGVVGGEWSAEGICLVRSSASSTCPMLDKCVDVRWSWQFPDAKSNIGSVNNKTGTLR